MSFLALFSKIRCLRAPLILIVIGTGLGTVNAYAFAGGEDALLGALAAKFTPAQLSALMASATGRVDLDTEQRSTALAQLGQLLDVSSDVALALLRMLDKPDIQPKQSVAALAHSAIEYHAVRDRLAVLTSEDPQGRLLVRQAQAAVTAGDFSTAEALLQQLEEQAVAVSGDLNAAQSERAPSGATKLAPSALESLIRAAEARSLLGEIALMKMEFTEATNHFQLARQRLEPLTAADLDTVATPPEEPSPTRKLAEQGNEVVTDRPGAIPSKLVPDAAPVTLVTVLPAIETKPLPQVEVGRPEHESVQVANSDRSAALHERDLAAIGLDTSAASYPIAAKTAAPRVLPEHRMIESPPAGDTSKGQSPALTLSADVLARLLRRADSLLALGDVSSARLLYERAAAGGDGRAATVAGRTYDPLFLSEIDARGIRGDLGVAAAWYRRAIDLGDQTSAERLKRMDQRR